MILQIEKYTPIAEYPHLHKEWHTEKNEAILMNNPKLTTNSKMWWICSNGHEYDATVYNRKAGKGCPYCSGQKVCKDNCLATVNPVLAAQWHETKNGTLTPYDVTAGSSRKKVWWVCTKGHEYQAVVGSRNRGTGCQICNNKLKGRRKVRDDNRLSLLYPILVEEWHPTKNKELQPEDVSYGSDKIVWWMCKRGHEFKSPISQRTRGNECAKCNSGLHTSFAEQAIYHYLKSDLTVVNNFRPIEMKGMEIDIYIPSLKIGIEYNGGFFHSNQNRQQVDILKEKSLNRLGITLLKVLELRENVQTTQIETKRQYIHRYGGHYSTAFFDSLDNCIKKIIQYLNNHYSQFLEIDIDSKRDRLIIFEKMQLRSVKKSLAFKKPELIDEWNFKRNENISPELVSYGSGIIVWWTCPNGHEYEMPVHKRSSRNSQCPICLGVKVIEETSLLTLFPEIAKEWHPTKNSFEPGSVRPGSNLKVWWICDQGHEWDAVISTRSKIKVGCPYCCGKRATIETCLMTTHPNIAEKWNYSKNGDITPYEVTKGSGKKYWWLCTKGHERFRSIRDEVKKRVNCHECEREKRKYHFDGGTRR
ncbi:zinc-ribbon domain-containing protein [Metabacillus sp. FJAT-52054]|uniref:Zinc-ribbon domain-containing protein n=1 Tax=Metabacillus sediminis TaxID=3117746 RepID=A0ABZ2NEZ5_9BACI